MPFLTVVAIIGNQTFQSVWRRHENLEIDQRRGNSVCIKKKPIVRERFDESQRWDIAHTEECFFSIVSQLLAFINWMAFGFNFCWINLLTKDWKIERLKERRMNENGMNDVSSSLKSQQPIVTGRNFVEWQRWSEIHCAWKIWAFCFECHQQHSSIMPKNYAREVALTTCNLQNLTLYLWGPKSSSTSIHIWFPGTM